MQDIYMGIDVAKEKFDLAISNKSTEKVIYKQFNNNLTGFKKLKSYIKKTMNTDNISIAMEATGSYSINLADFLSKNKYIVYIINPNKIKSFAIGSLYNAKTDKIDSEIILKFLIYNEKKLYAYKPLTDSERLLKAYVKRRASLMTQKLQEENKLETLPNGLKDIERSHNRIIKLIVKEIKTIENKMKELVKNNEEMKKKKNKITKVKGVGKLTAYTMISMVPELGKLKAKQVTALVGLAPYAKESGKKVYKRHIRKGRKDVKVVLYMAALTSINYNEEMKEFYYRLISKGKVFKVAITAVMRKLLVIMNAIMKTYIEENLEGELNVKNT